MKKIHGIIALLCCLVCQLPVRAQSNDTSVYVYIAAGAGFPASLHLNVNVLTKKGLFITVFKDWARRDSPNKPDDYHGKTSGGLQLFGNDSKNDYVYEFFNSTGLAIGKMFWGRDQRSRFYFQIGGGSGRFKEPVNFFYLPYYNPNPFTLFGPEPANYTYQTKTWKNVPFLYLKTGLELPVFRALGVDFHMFTNMNKYWKIFGVQGAVQLGYLRDRMKK